MNEFSSTARQQLPDVIFQQAIEHAAGGLIICDAQQPDLPIVYASPSFETLTGYSAAEVMGKNCRFLQGEERNQLGTEDIRNAVANGTSCKVLMHNYRKNGQPFWNELTISPLVNDEGIVTHYVGTQIDISHYLDTFKALQHSEAQYRHLYEEQNKSKEKLRRSEALLRAINNLPPTGIFVMDCHTNEALFVNSEFYRIWQLEHLQADVNRAQITGEDLLTECLSNIDLGRFVATSTAKDFTHGNKIIEDEVPLLDGRTLRRIYGPIQEDGTTFAYLYIFEDITDRKQSVQALAKATKAAEAANRAKSEFLANMSHELRSPLNAILGFTHILRESDTTETQRENLDIIYNSGEHLLDLINDILDISKIEAGHTVINASEFDLHRLIDELQQMFSNAVAQKDLRLVVERSPHLPHIIRSDRLKLRQILTNLLSNAVKFTDSGCITLQALTDATKAAAKSDVSHTLTFAITDTGPGIPSEDIPHLSEAFVQTQSGLTAHTGTGLGLAISHEYIQLLGGQLVVESVVDQGSTFSFQIKASAIEASAVEADTLQQPNRSENNPTNTGRITGLAPGQPTYKILVVDDVALNRRLLSHLLTSVGFEVQEAANGKEAIAQWQTWHPDLIWLDVRMPVMGGEETARQIRALDHDRATRLIALTANAFEEDKTAALTSGCDDFVSKPIKANIIFDKIAQHLGVRYQRETQPNGTHPSALGDETVNPTTIEPLTVQLIKQTSDEWQYALMQATLDLDDQRILELASQLPAHQQALTRAIEKQVKNLAYKKLLQVLQEAEAVAP